MPLKQQLFLFEPPYCEASCHFVIQSFGNSVIWLFIHLVIWSYGHSVIQAVGHLVIRLDSLTNT